MQVGKGRGGGVFPKKDVMRRVKEEVQPQVEKRLLQKQRGRRRREQAGGEQETHFINHSLDRLGNIDSSGWKWYSSSHCCVAARHERWTLLWKRKLWSSRSDGNGLACLFTCEANEFKRDSNFCCDVQADSRQQLVRHDNSHRARSMMKRAKVLIQARLIARYMGLIFICYVPEACNQNYFVLWPRFGIEVN